jgi:hypothetical protein
MPACSRSALHFSDLSDFRRAMRRNLPAARLVAVDPALVTR